MASTNTAIKKVKNQAGEAVDNIWVERLVRLGYAVRGFLYIVIGLLAAQVAFGGSGAPKDATGAIQVIGSQPFGKFLLVVMAIGLAGYSLWGFIRAIWDPLHKGSDANGMIQRLGFLWSGFSYGVLVLPTVQFLQGRGGAKTNTAQTQDLTAQLLRMPLGPWIVGLAGLIGIGGGLQQIYYAYRTDFAKDLKKTQMSADEKRWAIRFGKFGYAARGVVFMLIGIFLVQAAVTVNPSKAQGLDGALLKLAQTPYGPLVLGIVALGLICFGLYSIFAARWVRV